MGHWHQATFVQIPRTVTKHATAIGALRKLLLHYCEYGRETVLQQCVGQEGAYRY